MGVKQPWHVHHYQLLLTIDQRPPLVYSIRHPVLYTMQFNIVAYDFIVLCVSNVCIDSGLLHAILGQSALALESLNMAAKYQPQDYSIFLHRAEIYEKVLCPRVFLRFLNISHFYFKQCSLYDHVTDNVECDVITDGRLCAG